MRINFRGGGVGIPAQAGESHGDISGGFAAVSVCQPTLSAAGSGFDAGFFWFAVFSSVDAGVLSGAAGAQAAGTGNSEADLFGIYSAAVAAGRGALFEWQVR